MRIKLFLRAPKKQPPALRHFTGASSHFYLKLALPYIPLKQWHYGVFKGDKSKCQGFFQFGDKVSKTEAGS